MPLKTMLRKGAGWSLIMTGCGTLMALDQLDIVVNGSDSLAGAAYIMWEQPRFLDHGTIVAAKMPAPLEERFGEHVFVKRIGGMPGDVIEVTVDGTACIEADCYPPMLKDGVPVSAPIEAQVIPEGYYALVGDAPDSLDSRYDVIGLMPEDQLVGRGWTLPWFPGWQEAAKWF